MTKPTDKGIIRWLHLSDFHVGKDDYGQRKMFKYILDQIRTKIDLGLAPHLVFITGDVSNKGLLEEYETFNYEFVLPLIDLLGLEGELRLFIVPGNHDVDRSKNKLVDRQTIAKKAPRFLDPTKEGLEYRQEVLGRFGAYTNQDMSAAQGKWLNSIEGAFVFRRSIAGSQIGIVGINTAWLSQDEKDRHELTPGIEIIETALDQLKACDIRLVLGHHPLNWLKDSDVGPLGALFGKHQVIYLHGHLHINEAKTFEAVGRQFLTIQSGASFQAREDEVWRNRILWCELDPNEQIVRAEPLLWSRNDKEWKLDGDAFPERYRTPGMGQWLIPIPNNTVQIERDHKRIEKFLTPAGWDVINSEALSNRKKGLTDELLLRFFDGSVPSWNVVLSEKVPRRDVVTEIANYIGQAHTSEKIRVILVAGPGGEGKSTVFMQIIGALVDREEGWQVLWRHDEVSPLPTEFIHSLPPGKWLIAADEAGTVAKDVAGVLAALNIAGRKDVCFLLCSRDTDWLASKGDNHPWADICAFDARNLRGLTKPDASLIVKAWSSLGHKGLGELAGLSSEEATERLAREARQESSLKEGAFLGAMLRTRIGDGIRGHVRSLLERLGMRKAVGMYTLRDAFAYIATLHAEDRAILLPDVLANVLGCDRRELKRHVIVPLGMESAAVSTGMVILTRHRAIAEHAVDILSSEMGYDTELLTQDLVLGAERAKQSGVYIEYLAEWRYICDHFFEQGRKSFAIRLAHALKEFDPTNSFFATKLGQLYRKAGQPEQSTQTYRQLHIGKFNPKGLLILLTDWATSEGVSENYALNAWLAAFSLSDQTSIHKTLRKDNAATALSYLAVAFNNLHQSTSDPVFGSAGAATAHLSLLLQSEGEREDIQRNLYRIKAIFTLPQTSLGCLENLKLGIVFAWERREDELSHDITAGNELTFRTLERLILNVDLQQAPR